MSRHPPAQQVALFTTEVSSVTATVKRSRVDIMAGLMKSQNVLNIVTVRVKLILTAVFFSLQFVQQTSGKH